MNPRESPWQTVTLHPGSHTHHPLFPPSHGDSYCVTIHPRGLKAWAPPSPMPFPRPSCFLILSLITAYQHLIIGSFYLSLAIALFYHFLNCLIHFLSRLTFKRTTLMGQIPSLHNDCFAPTTQCPCVPCHLLSHTASPCRRLSSPVPLSLP